MAVKVVIAALSRAHQHIHNAPAHSIPNTNPFHQIIFFDLIVLKRAKIFINQFIFLNWEVREFL